MKQIPFCLLVTLILVFFLPYGAGFAAAVSQTPILESGDDPFLLNDLPHLCNDTVNQMIISFAYANWNHDYVEGTPVMTHFKQ